MADRDLFLVTVPEEAARIARSRVLPGVGEDPVELGERRRSGWAAVAVRVPEGELRPGGLAGTFLVDRVSVTRERVGRAFQPWHADVEPDELARWRGYLQAGSERVLRNFVGAVSVEQLRVREDRRVTAALVGLADRPVAQTFDLAHVRAIHDRLFERVYPWAGETRTTDLSKGTGGEPFVFWGAVEPTFAYVAEQLANRDHLRGMGREEFVAGAGWAYDAVNTIHAFREGNGRAQRVWLDDLAAHAGWQFAWERVSGVENDATSARARRGDLAVMRSMLDRISEPLDPATAERRRVQRSFAQLQASRAPMSGIGAGDPGPRPAARPGPVYGVRLQRDKGYDR